MNLDKLIKSIVEEHRNQPITRHTVRNWVETGGIDFPTAVALIEVLIWIWPKKRVLGHPTCRKLVNRKVCGAPIVHSELKSEPEGEMLVLICDKKHVTRKLMKALDDRE